MPLTPSTRYDNLNIPRLGAYIHAIRLARNFSRQHFLDILNGLQRRSHSTPPTLTIEWLERLEAGQLQEVDPQLWPCIAEGLFISLEELLTANTHAVPLMSDEAVKRMLTTYGIPSYRLDSTLAFLKFQRSSKELPTTPHNILSTDSFHQNHKPRSS